MQKASLTALARHELDSARASSSGRSAKTVHGGHERQLRQTLIALCTGESLSEHENPGEATVYLIEGRVELTSGDDSGPDGWVTSSPFRTHRTHSTRLRTPLFC